ncbi:hypothetical protein FRC03_009421 [Tulasnella sp. 419]|nr:hypothetical protein FRC02_001017 [Tulasnella sp. 418]KAG8967728.1 hypothetical protein FRC03_009421 [Tulasnella sp. 419]
MSSSRTGEITISSTPLEHIELESPQERDKWHSFYSHNEDGNIHDINNVVVPDTAVSLPPVDTGFHAYAYLGSAFVFELLVWSFPFSYGVFLNYYNTVLFDPKDPEYHLLPLVGTLSSGILYIFSLFVLPVVLRFPSKKRQISMIGLILCVASLVGAGLSSRPSHLILTQGIMYPIGGTMLYFPILTWLVEWFSEKRGLANGILFSGTGLGGVVVPFVSEALLNRFGHRLAFFILSALFFVIALPAFLFAKPRVPAAQRTAATNLDTSFLRNAFANDLRLSTTSGTLGLALMNVASVPGLLIVGYMSDKYDLRLAISLCTFGGSMSVFLIWGFTKQLATLLVFACAYGFSTGSFSVLWPRFIGVINQDDHHLYTTLMSLFVASRGLGNVLSGPLSTSLLRHSPMYDRAAFGYGVKGYGPLILFTGSGLLVSTIAAAYPMFTRRTALDIRGGI